MPVPVLANCEFGHLHIYKMDNGGGDSDGNGDSDGDGENDNNQTTIN